MSAYGKVSYVNGEDSVNETLTQNFEGQTGVEEQVNKFDNTYATNEKLQELYNEFDKITLDQDKIKEYTQVKTNAVSRAIPFRVALTMSTVLLVTVLMVFLCIYNIFVINNMSKSITYLQEEVVSAEYDLTQSKGLYDKLTSTENIQKELSDMGYTDIDSSNIVAVSVPEKVEVAQLQGQTNWFDAICNFISRILG